MISLIYKNPTNEIRGKTRRFLYEIDPGIFTGDISATVRETLWKEIVSENVSAIMIYPAKNEQGFKVKKNGDFHRYDFVNMEGIMLSTKRKVSAELSDIYAKPDKTLLQHSLETGLIAEQIMRHGVGQEFINSFEQILNIDKEKLIQSIAFLCAVHDIGKIHPGFQKNILDDNKLNILKSFGLYDKDCKPIRHERYSRSILNNYFKNKGSKRYASDFAQIVAYHHQGKESNDFCDKIIIKSKPEEWERLQNEFIAEIEKQWQFDFDLESTRNCRQGFTYCILSIMITADWIASGEQWNQFIKSNKSDSLIKQAQTFLEKNKLINNKSIKEMAKGKISFFDIFGFNPNTLQQKVISLVEGHNNKFDLLIIESPCGTGKTEAGMIAALMGGQNKSGIYVAMPTTATIKNILPRIRKMMKLLGCEDNIPEFDSDAIWSDESEDKIDKELWVSSSRHQMIYPSAVGTIDQLLKTISIYRYAAIGMLGLANKVIVIDEIHSYDAYMGTKIERLLEYCKMLNVPVVMLSATLDDQTKRRYIKASDGNVENLNQSYPLITMVNNGNVEEETFYVEGKDIPISIVSADNITDAMIEKAEIVNGCSAVIMPTVDDAIYTYDVLKEKKHSVSLFHSRDTVIGKELKADGLFKKYGTDNRKQNRPANELCIATSIIEMSIDVDFDNMVTAICPIDSLIQRIGRYHRHEDKDTIREKGMGMDPVVVITAPERGNLNYVYDSSILDATERVLNKLNGSFNTVKDVRKLINDVYEDTLELEKRLKSEYMNSLNAYTDILNVPSERDEMNIGEYSDDYRKFNPRFVSIRKTSYPTTKVAIVSEKDMEGDDFSVAKRIIKSRVVNVASNKLKGFEKSDIYNSNNKLLDDVTLYFSENSTVIGDEYLMKISEDKGLFFEKKGE